MQTDRKPWYVLAWRWIVWRIWGYVPVHDTRQYEPDLRGEIYELPRRDRRWFWCLILQGKPSNLSWGFAEHLWDAIVARDAAARKWHGDGVARQKLGEAALQVADIATRAWEEVDHAE